MLTVDKRSSGIEWGRRGVEEGPRRGRWEEKGWDEGERCLERGSGVRDWKTEEAGKLHSDPRQLCCV